jgi:hypothetical protein
MIDELRRQRVLRVIRAFFRDWHASGTPRTQSEIDAYHRALREAAAGRPSPVAEEKPR